MDLLASLLDRLVAVADLIALILVFWLVAARAERRAPAEGLSAADVAAVGPWLGLGALIGARLGVVLPDWPRFVRHPLDLVYITGGLSFFGGLAGALVALVWLGRRRGLPTARLADLFAPPLALGIAVYRLASLALGTSGGALAAPPWGLILPGYTQSRYPVAIWEGALTLAVFAFLLWRRDHRRFPGELAILLLVLYPLLRAGLDFFRIHMGAWPSPDQALALTSALLAALVWLWRVRGSAEPPL